MTKLTAPEILYSQDAVFTPFSLQIKAKMREVVKQRRGKDWNEKIVIPLSDFVDTYCETAAHSARIPDLDAEMHIVFSANNLAAILPWAVFSWAYTKGIYRFDPDLLSELKSSEFVGSIQRDVLFRLPEPVTVIHVPGLYDEGFEYVFFLFSPDPSSDSLRMYVIFQDGENDTTDPTDWDSSYHWFSLNKESLEIEDFWPGVQIENADSKEALYIKEHYIREEFIRLYPEENPINISISDQSAAIGVKLTARMKKILPFLLYLCTYNPDIQLVTPLKQLKASPDMPKKYIVGQRVGQVLRKYKKQYLQTGSAIHGKGTTKRPHYRCAYFRQQLYGAHPLAGEPDRREHRLKWIAASYVNMKDMDPASQISTTIKRMA